MVENQLEFEWDDAKDALNQQKHGVSFELAMQAFLDDHRIIAVDLAHSTDEETRYYCFARVDGGVMTVRYTMRDDMIRIIGAGYWRQGKKTYEERHAHLFG